MGLINSLVLGDVEAIRLISLVGLVPAVIQYASTKWPLTLRMHAAVFLHTLGHSGNKELLILAGVGGFIANLLLQSSPLWEAAVICEVCRPRTGARSALHCKSCSNRRDLDPPCF